MMRRTPMKRTGWARSSTTVPSAGKNTRNSRQSHAAKAQAAIKNESKTALVCEILQVRNFGSKTALALTSKALVAIKSLAQALTSSTKVHARPKNAPVRNETYRRAVASLPCCICGVSGYSQAAHGSAGKGMGIKAFDLTLFPACCDRLSVRGCHSRLDQGALLSKAVRHQLEPVWAADTQRRVRAMGLWPKKLPILDANSQGNNDASV